MARATIVHSCVNGGVRHKVNLSVQRVGWSLPRNHRQLQRVGWSLPRNHRQLHHLVDLKAVSDRLGKREKVEIGQGIDGFAVSQSHTFHRSLWGSFFFFWGGRGDDIIALYILTYVALGTIIDAPKDRSSTV